MKTQIFVRLLAGLLLAIPAGVQAQFSYTTNDGTITITGYTGTNVVVVIPDTIDTLPVTTIDQFAFFGPTLISITIPNSVTNIRGDAFYCSSLTNIMVDPLNSTYSSVDGVLFNQSQTILVCYPSGKVGGYTIPNSVTSIGNLAFAGCTSLTNVTIPNSVSSIGDYAFNDCLSLISVSIPNSVTNIGDYAFIDCTSLTSVSIPQSVTNIGTNAFYQCSNLADISVAPNSPAYSSLGGVLLNRSQTMLIDYPAGKVATSYTIPNSVTSIGDFAFAGCVLTSVTVSSGVTNIGNEAFTGCPSLTNATIGNNITNIGEVAFYGCRSLTAINVDTNNPAYSSVDGVLFNKSLTTLIEYPEGKTTWGQEYPHVVPYTVPNGVTSIGIGAFATYNGFVCLTTITVPGSVTNIGYAAFGSYGLNSVYFQGNVPTADSSVFDANWGYPTVYYLPGTIGWSNTFGGAPTALWTLPYPLILGGKNSSPSFGVQTNGFSFAVSWATNLSVVVEASSDLANLDWSPVATNTLIGGSSSFTDPRWANYPKRFYRIRSQ